MVQIFHCHRVFPKNSYLNILVRRANSEKFLIRHRHRTKFLIFSAFVSLLCQFFESSLLVFRSGQMSSQASGVDVMDCTSCEGAGNGADGGDALPESYVTTSNTNVKLC